MADTKSIRVYPANGDIEKVLRHPMGFVLSAQGSKWPADQFTLRRLEDGSVTETPPKAKEQTKPVTKR